MNNRIRYYFLPSIADVFFISVLFYLASSGDKGNLLSDGDTGYHIRAGEYILSTLSIPKTDIFSFITPTLPWTAHEWLVEVVMALLHQLGGLTAVNIFFSLMISFSVLIFFKNIRFDGNNILLAVLACSAFVTLTMVHWLARPHIFSLIILLFWQRIIDDFQYRQRNRLWILPIIMLLWVNIHGGFIIGLAILGIYSGGNYLLKFYDSERYGIEGKEKTAPLLKFLGISIIACFANPIGYKIFLFPFKLISSKFIMDHTTEFMSPNFHELQPFKYLLFLLILVFAYSKKTPNLIEITLILLFTSMSLTSVRYIPLFGVIVIPILLRYVRCNCLAAFPKIESFFRKRLENITLIDSQSKGYLWPTACILLFVFLATNGSVTHAFNSEKKPMAAIEFLRENPVAGNMFNNDEFGDFVIYTSSDRYKVFIDGRLDMYGSERLKEYYKISSFEPEWEQIINKYNISWIFFDTKSALSRYLIINNDWKLIYSDKVASIFVKDIPVYQPLINKYQNVKLANYSTGEKDGP